MTDIHRLPIPFGPFILLERAGAGGMGVVWRGRHQASGLEVAIKTLRADAQPRATEQTSRALFDASLDREVRAIAALNHARVVRVLDHGRTSAEDTILGGDLPWLAMTWMPGGPLKASSVTDWGSVRSTVKDVLEGLAWAHAHGVLHRDIKPSNVLGSGDGRWALADFGIARLPQGADPLSGWGSPEFMAPEQR
ncbi:MAG: serine/threonine-protein kinase [Myxococcota bacterium]